MTNILEEIKEKAKKEAEEISQQIRLKEKLKIISGQELLRLQIPATEFLIEKLIPDKSLCIISGKPSSFKSWVLLLIAKQVALGHKLFGEFEVKAKKVLYLDEETDRSEQKRRWQMMGPEDNVPVFFSSMAGFKIDQKCQKEFLLSFCVENEFGLLIIDSLRDVHTQNENDSKDAQVIIDGFREFTQQGISVIISHHNRKESFLNSKDPSQMLRGSDAILAGLDALIAIENPKATEESAELIITQSKLRQGKKLDAFKVSVFEKESKMNFEYLGSVENEETKLTETKNAIKDILKEQGELYRQEIIDILIPLYFTQATIRRSLKELIEDKEIQPVPKGVKTYFRLVQ
jgi:RecA-family ATPase